MCIRDRIYISRKEHFNAAHKLANPNWSKEKNEEVFGPCANENWHGHNYELIVTLKGEINPETGYLVDLKKLSDLLKREIIDVFDHKNINLDVPCMKGKMASTENIVIAMWELLYDKIENMGEGDVCMLHSLKLYETPRNFVEYFG